MTEKLVRYPLSFSPRNLPKGLFVEMNFSHVLPNFLWHPLAATDIAGAGFTLTISNAEEIAVVMIVEGDVRVARILL